MKTWQLWLPFIVFLIAATIMTLFWSGKSNEEKYPGADPLVEPDPVQEGGVCVELLDGTSDYYPDARRWLTEEGFLGIYARGYHARAVYSVSAVKVAYGGPCREASDD